MYIPRYPSVTQILAQVFPDERRAVRRPFKLTASSACNALPSDPGSTTYKLYAFAHSVAIHGAALSHICFQVLYLFLPIFLYKVFNLTFASSRVFPAPSTSSLCLVYLGLISRCLLPPSLPYPRGLPRAPLI
ncbi:hypothetical protein GGS23DRAFT_523652 [Durotheca rogersii]|uniref:uncharacterized protein n=1 Tax=Durotheca rogersii TaxID=419775 RepID=UPI002220C36B|nr:uncharacterized protein GGS23DRAFT_523652 [Durotheca rogersii]KAI5863984.1 hypothetical protein GGS23DRAFT_523652 [Durotheca rogersii]